MRRSFTLGTKKKVATEAKKIGTRAAARKFKVDRKCIRTWLALDARGAFDEYDDERRRVDGAGRPLVCEELEELLVERIVAARRAHRRVTQRKCVEMAAAILADMEEPPNLQLSDGWLQCFLHRHALVQRKATNKPKLTPEAICARGANFVRHFRQLIEDYDITPANIVNFDETAVFAEHSKDMTLDERGTTDVPIKSFGLEKVRVTAVFGARADGTKLKPCLMIRGKVAGVTTEQGIPVLVNKNSWMDTESFIRYVDYMFPFPEPNKLLLVFDSARSHISKKAKAHLQARKILFAVIPGGLTPYLQPCDYGMFKPLKDTLADIIDKWKEHGPHELTSGGNVKPPTRGRMIEWMKAAWEAVVPPSIRLSFRSCFMGTDDELALARHDLYGPEFRRLLGGNEPEEVLDELSQLLLADEGSDMDVDDMEIDFA